jgi:Zn-finger nucleic acid-binding protein
MTMLFRRKTFLAMALVAGGAAVAGAQERPDSRTVECASRDGRRMSCPADLQGYTFRNLRKQSDAPCEAGRNWGYTERGVWVDAGCRAEFEFERATGALAQRDTDRGMDRDTDRDADRSVGPVSRTDERVVQCASEDNRREDCSADLRGMRFADVRQLSRTTCEIGRNFGYNDRGVWVDQGCRGEFLFRSADRVAAYSEGGASNVRGNIVACESVHDDYEHCKAEGAVSARVARQLSDAECVQGSTWGVDERGIWVDRGCRAEFEVFTRLSDSPTAPQRW